MPRRSRYTHDSSPTTVKPVTVDLSRPDRVILHELQRDGLKSNAALGTAANISESAAARHRHRLERSGYIERYAAVVNVKRLGYDQVVFVDIGLASQHESALRAFEAAVKDVEEVVACHTIAGDLDYLLRVVARDFHDYERILHRLAQLPGVEHLHTRVVLKNVLEREVIPPA